MGFEVVNGIARQLLLSPWLGDVTARQVSFIPGCCFIMAVTWLTIDWIGTRSGAQRWTVGLLWAVATLLFEILLTWTTGMPWDELLEDYNLMHGRLMGVGLLILLAAPETAWRCRRRKR